MFTISSDSIIKIGLKEFFSQKFNIKSLYLDIKIRNKVNIEIIAENRFSFS